MAKEILIVDPMTVELSPQPLLPDWILSGAPVGRNQKLVTTKDLTAAVIVWDCTPGTFRWTYAQEETVVVIAGEAFMTNEQGEERRFAAGDVGFFPAGYSCQWRITKTFRKVAVVREAIWTPIGYGVKVWNKLLRTVGLKPKSSL